MRARHLRPNFDEKQGAKSRISSGEKYFLNLENREEKEKLFYKILKIERRKRNSIQKSCEPRGEKKYFLEIWKIERRTRHEKSLLQIERENQE